MPRLRILRSCTTATWRTGIEGQRSLSTMSRMVWQRSFISRAVSRSWRRVEWWTDVTKDGRVFSFSAPWIRRRANSATVRRRSKRLRLSPPSCIHLLSEERTTMKTATLLDAPALAAGTRRANGTVRRCVPHPDELERHRVISADGYEVVITTVHAPHGVWLTGAYPVQQGYLIMIGQPYLEAQSATQEAAAEQHNQL